MNGEVIRPGGFGKSLSDCFYGKNRGMVYIDDNNKDKVTVFGSIRNTGLAKRFYERRMGIEEMFRDMKTGFGLKKIRTGNRIRFENLISFSLPAYPAVVTEDGRLKEKNKYLSYFPTVIYYMIIRPSVLRQFSPMNLFENGKL